MAPATDSSLAGLLDEQRLACEASTSGARPRCSREESEGVEVAPSKRQRQHAAGASSKTVSNQGKGSITQAGGIRWENPSGSAERPSRLFVSSSGELVPYKVPYSSICPADHAFYLENAARYKDLSPSEQMRFDDCHKRAAREGEERKAFFQKLASQHPERYHRHSARAAEFYGSHVSNRVRELLKVPNEYRVCGAVALKCCREMGGVQGLLQHQQRVCSLGSLRMMERDNLKEYLPQNDIIGGEMMDRLQVSCVPPIEEDVLATELCKVHCAGVSMTSDALCSLISLVPENFDSPWEIPVRVSLDEDQRTKQVVMGNPLPKYSLSAKEMLTQVAEAGIENCIRNHPQQSQRGTGVVSEFQVCDASKLCEGASCTEGVRVLSKNVLEASSNLFYSTWTFGDLRLLVRYSYLGLLKGTNRSDKYACCSAKLEYSLHENYEEYTVPEMMKWWSRLFVHPNSHLLLARVEAESEKVVRTERMNRATIDACRSNKFNPEIGVENFYGILQHVMTLPQGSYILSHRRGENRVLCLSEARGGSDKGTIACTSKPRGLLNTEIELVPPAWRAEDPDQPQIPGTFPPWKQRGQWFFQKNKKVVRHCQAYLRGEACAGKMCPLPHLSRQELAQCETVHDKCLKLFKKRVSHMKSVPHCFAHLKGQPCPFGGAEKCIYPHLSQRCLEELSKLCRGP